MAQPEVIDEDFVQNPRPVTVPRPSMPIAYITVVVKHNATVTPNANEESNSIPQAP